MDTFYLEMIDDPSMFKVNALPAHADTILYASEEERVKNSWQTKGFEALEERAGTGGSSLAMSLNGMWKFHYAKNPDAILPGFEQADYDVSLWDEISVPSNIQMQGNALSPKGHLTGIDTPAYVNTQYPWDGREEVPLGSAPRRFNPTAQYVRYFELPEFWKGMGVHISFKGVESGFALWVNGKFVGYSEDSFTPTDFDLTPYVTDGINRIAVLNFKFTCGSWFEDQDMFRLSGIFRDVVLTAVPSAHIEDVRVTAEPDDEYMNGKLLSQVAVSGNTADAKICWKLIERGCAQKSEGAFPAFPEDSVAASGEAALDSMISSDTVSDTCSASKKRSEKECGIASCRKAVIEAEISNPKLWSAEVPYIYELVLTLTDADGNVIETTSQLIGFRRFEMKDGLMLLNGKRIVFNGVNRHEFSCTTGRSPRAEDILTDILIMKRNNINAVRTSHYPNGVLLYHLCDIFGLYMIAENNMETHGSWGYPNCTDEKKIPNDHEEFADMMLDRVRSTYHRDKNHPSILIWSCGNESYGGSVIYRMSEEFRRLDPTRLVHYEGIFWDRRYEGTSDMESQMYTTAANVEKFLEEHPEKPFILCEYTHSMGNSNGGMHRYIELSERNPRYQGGFIWDFVDQAVAIKTRYGEDALAYGGDFGERPTDYEFSGNGIVDARRRPYGKMQEVRYNYRSINANVSMEGFTVTNKNLFVNTDQYDCVILLDQEGERVAAAPAKVSLMPLETAAFLLPEEITEKMKEAGEYVITVSFRLREDTPWEKRGYEIAFGQGVFRVNGNTEREGSEGQMLSGSENTLVGDFISDSDIRGRKGLVITRGTVNIGVRGTDFEVLFSEMQGGLVSYRYAGRELIEEMPKPNFWRAVTNNDTGNRMAPLCGVWKLATQYQTFNDPHLSMFDVSCEPEDRYPKIEEKDNCVEIMFRRFLPTVPQSMAYTTYRVFADGTVRMILSCEPSAELPPMPEFGWQFVLNADYHHVTYYGMGPEENYCDRKQGAKLGIYTRDAEDFAEHYLMPQETGNRTGVRWAKITDDGGKGIMLRAAMFPECKDSEASKPGEMEFSALPYDQFSLENALHAYELPRIYHTFIKCSLKQMGVAGDDSWGAKVLPEYLLPTGQKLIFAVDLKGI